MKTRRPLSLFVFLLAAGPTAALASVQSGPVEPDVVINFEDIPNGTPANNLRIGGVTFSFDHFTGQSGASLLGVSGAVVGSDFPTTPNTGGQGIQGSPIGALGFKFDRPVSSLAFGFALHAAGGNQFFGDGSVRNAVVVDLFDPQGGFIGSFSDDGMGFIPDTNNDEKYLDDRFASDRGGGAEYNTGRFATAAGLNIGSASIFFATEGLPPSELRQLSGGVLIDLFFFDNLSFVPTTIPLPTPLLLAGAGLVTLASIRRRRGL